MVSERGLPLTSTKGRSGERAGAPRGSGTLLMTPSNNSLWSNSSSFVCAGASVASTTSSSSRRSAGVNAFNSFSNLCRLTLAMAPLYCRFMRRTAGKKLRDRARFERRRHGRPLHPRPSHAEGRLKTPDEPGKVRLETISVSRADRDVPPPVALGELSGGEAPHDQLLAGPVTGCCLSAPQQIDARGSCPRAPHPPHIHRESQFQGELI